MLGDYQALLPWLMLALGGALVVGNVAALVRPPEQRREGDLDEAPKGRTAIQILIGGVTAGWALISLVS
ncbi:MAG: hypothetical protein GY929_25135 [Actinomycetia bacterium]|nr:hypothetical protein [Actinomycetes bacterium]